MRKYYSGITLFKLMGALLVVCAHIIIDSHTYEIWSINLQSSVRMTYVIVPVFYMIAGFLAYKGWSHSPNPRQYIRKYLRWIIMIYALLCLISIGTNVVPLFLTEGFTPKNVFQIFKLVFIKGAYPQLWFIPPLIIAIYFTYRFRHRLHYALMWGLMGFFMAQLISGPFRLILDQWIISPSPMEVKMWQYSESVLSSYFGLCLIFVVGGAFIAKQDVRISNGRLAILLLAALTTMGIDIWFMDYYTDNYPYRLALSLLPNGIFLFLMVLRLKVPFVQRQHAFINLFTIVAFFSHFVFIFINLYFLNWELRKLTDPQELLMVGITLLECIVLTRAILFLKNYIRAVKTNGDKVESDPIPFQAVKS